MDHTFNNSTWESCAFNSSNKKENTGRDMDGSREDYKVGWDSTFSQRIYEEFAYLCVRIW